MKRFFLLASVLLLLAGCTGQPVYNIDQADIITGSGSAPSLVDVRRAIIEAANSKGWTVKDIDESHVQVTQRTSQRSAVVVIAFSTTTFSMTYQDSHRLKYNGTTIHRRYNGWVRKLERRIRSKFIAL